MTETVFEKFATAAATLKEEAADHSAHPAQAQPFTHQGTQNI